MESIAAGQIKMLATSPFSPDFAKLKSLQAQRAAAGAAYAQILMLKPSLTKEFSVGRASGRDLGKLEEKVRRLQIRAGGLYNWYNLVMRWVERDRRQQTEKTQLNGKKVEEQKIDERLPEKDNVGENGIKPEARVSVKKLKESQHVWPFGSNTNGQQKSHSVHLYESIKHMDLENRTAHPSDSESIDQLTTLSSKAANRLLTACKDSISVARLSLEILNSQRVRHRFGFGTFLRHSQPKTAPDLKHHLSELQDALAEFRLSKRKDVLLPYDNYFTTALQSDEGLPTRGLFYLLLYHFQLIEFASGVEELLETVVTLDSGKTVSLHWPQFNSIRDLIAPRRRAAAEPDQDAPEEVEGAPLLEKADPRDPDADRPKNPLQFLLLGIFSFFQNSTTGNLFYA